MRRAFYVVAILSLLGACSSNQTGERRWAGFNNCSADGSVVLWEYADKNGSYEGLKNGPCKK